MKLSGWGQFPVVDTRMMAPETEGDIAQALSLGGAIARGLGRAYGDSAIGEQTTIDMRGFNRVLSFDPATGIFIAEAGCPLHDVIDIALPQGWFPLVTPGTKFVTLGGMIAADVHGKNHHRDGSMRASVHWLDLMTPAGDVTRCSLAENAEVFDHTLGGMGLTGVILRCAIQLRPVESAWITQTTQATRSLEETIEACESTLDATYSVAWIDAISSRSKGRSILMLGEHARLSELGPQAAQQPLQIAPKASFRVPVTAPGWLLNGWTAAAFNATYWRYASLSAGRSLVNWDSYFYPLDRLLEWHKLYGRRGLLQFQCVLPVETSLVGMKALLSAASQSGVGCILAVLKRFGDQTGAFSFPKPGYTLALDFPVSRRSLALMDRFDGIVADHGGRLYLAKDARMTADALRRTDSRMEDFSVWRRRDLSDASPMMSRQAQRLQL